jgi:hypothetical protein
MMIHKIWKSAGARNIERYFERKRNQNRFSRKMQNVGCQEFLFLFFFIKCRVVETPKIHRIPIKVEHPSEGEDRHWSFGIEKHHCST